MDHVRLEVNKIATFTLISFFSYEIWELSLRKSLNNIKTSAEVVLLLFCILTADIVL